MGPRSVVSRAVTGECKAWWLAAVVLIVFGLVSVVFAEIPARRRISELIRHDQLPAAEQQLWDVLNKIKKYKKINKNINKST